MANQHDQCNANNTLVLTDETQFDFLYTTENRLFVTVAIPLVSIFGILNNLAFIFMLYRVKRMRTTTNFYLGNLAFSDAGFLILLFTKHTWTYLLMAPVERGIAWSKSFGCSAPYVFIYTFNYSSAFLITIVTAERYFAICHPMTHRRLDGKARAVTLVLISWTLSLALALFEANPASIKTTCLEFPEESILVELSRLVIIRECIVRCRWCWNVTYFIDTIQFFAAFFANLAMYSGIVSTLNHRDIGSTAEASADNAEAIPANIRLAMDKARNTVARMLAINSVVYFVCLFPFKITNVHAIILIFEGPPIMSDVSLLTLMWLGRTLTLVNASINPFIYGVTNTKYRVAYYEAFYCRHMLAAKDTKVNTVYRTDITKC